MELARALRELVLPPRCLCCNCLGQDVCNSCSQVLRHRELRTYADNLPIYSSIVYGTEARSILLAAKENHIRAADEVLEGAVRFSLRRAMRIHRSRPVLVPVPHSKKASRARGRNFVAQLSINVANEENIPIRLLLEHNREVKDQSQLDAHARKINLAGSMSVTKQHGRPCEVILVDDLVTSGATLSEAVKALERGGFSVIAGVTALVTLPLR